MGSIRYRDGGLVCPACDALGLKVLYSEELGPDDRSDERSRQVVHCATCGLRTLAVYEESRRGASESAHHYTLDPEQVDVASLRAGLRKHLGS